MALSVDFAQHHTVRLSRELESLAADLPGGAKTLRRGFGAGGSIAKDCALHTRPDEKVLVADIVKTSDDVSSLRFVCSTFSLFPTPALVSSERPRQQDFFSKTMVVLGVLVDEVEELCQRAESA